MMEAAASEWGVKCQQRLNLGAEQYGPFKFLELDTLEMAIEEVIDLANYAFMTYVKLRLLQDAVAEQARGVIREPDGFVRMSEVLKVKGS